ncbi:MAG: 50S ribosomal protein L9 [Candidatus Omnitrophica bacterium 4484_70.2]|nr:MAG: 50S ribosomal protein L9 [Candidatus Omnitrophica bacterium 4484_70.2]
MKIILLKNIEKLGKEGEVVEVKDGYARNYLLPQGFALKAEKKYIERWKEIKKRREKIREKKEEVTLSLKERIEKLSLTITCEVKKDDEIYGSVGVSQILSALKEEGVELRKNNIELDEPIRKLGIYTVKVKLSPQQEAFLKLWVVKK